MAAGFLDVKSNADQVEATYIAYFGRAADGPGYLYWNNNFAAQIAAGHTDDATASNIASSFAVQPEATVLYGFLASPPGTLSTTDPVQIAAVDSFINSVYHNLFNRAPDGTGGTAPTGGLGYWQTQILTGAVSVGAAVFAIGNGALNTATGTGTAATGFNDQTVLGAKITAASFFTTQTFAANLGTTIPLTPGFLAAAKASVIPVVDTNTGTTQDAGSVATSEAATTAFIVSVGTTSLGLTPNPDNLSTNANNAVFNGLGIFDQFTNTYSQTITTGDILTDTGTGGVLNGQFTAGATGAFASSFTMTGIPTANLTSIVAGAGFAGTITNLTTVNDNGSTAGITLGAIGAGLKTALTNVSINGFIGANGSTPFTGIIAAAAGAATNTINIALNGALGANGGGLADHLVFSTDGSPGTKAAPNLSYGTWSITANGNQSLQLMQNGVGGATTLKLAGAGNVALGQDGAGNWQKLTTIDASASTGNVTITGAVAGVASNTVANAASNPGGLFGSALGLLVGNTALTSYVLSGGTGVNILDVSSFTTNAQLAALTTSLGTTTPNTATTNEIIVTSANADTVAATTWANIKGFQIVGIGGSVAGNGAGGDTGTINLANLPSSVNDILYQTAASGPLLTINNLPTTFTVDTEANGVGSALTIGAIGPAGGTSDNFTLIVGTGSAVGVVGAVTLGGEENVTLTSNAPAGTQNTVGFMLLAPTLTGAEHVTIQGSGGAIIGSGGLGAIADVAGGALNTNNMLLTITETGTGAVVLHAATAAASALFTPIVGDTALGSTGSPLTNSTNAVTIDAHTAVGGLIMEGGDANFTTSTTVGGSIGDTIIGAATAGNVLGGSIGNDTITGSTSTTLADTVYTGGGADAITLSAGHVASDHVELYSGFSTVGIVAGGVEIGRIASVVDGADVPQLGWWGQATGQVGGAVQAATTNAGTALGFGTSADMSTVTNFVAGAPQDTVDISLGSFSGLIHDAATNGFLAVSPAAGAALSNPVGGGGTVTTAAAGVILLANNFSGAAGLATSLAAGGTAIHFGAALPLTGAVGEHFIIAYQDLGGNTRIADLDIHTTAAGLTSTAGGATETIAVSDLVQLTGVPLSAIHNGNIHFTA